MVYVLNQDGHPIMPTVNHAKVRVLLKNGKANQAEYLVKGYRLFDRVQYHGKEYFIFGRRSSGFFDIRTLDGEKVNKGSISYKKLKLLNIKKGILIERRTIMFL